MGHRRVLSFAVLVIGIGGLVASQTATAVAAFGASAIAMLFVVRQRRERLLGIAAVALLIAGGLIAVAFSPRTRERADRMIVDVNTGDYDDLLSGRLLPFLSSWSMGADHPLFGVGPGGFRWQYYDYKIRISRDHPLAAESALRGTNFAEVHNEYLQIFAETGVVGVAMLFVALFILGDVASSSPTPTDERTPKRRFAATLSLPLSLSFCVLALAQFPLHLAATSVSYLYLAALCVRWRTP